MATLSNRLTSNGTLLLNGNFDEVTYNSTTPTIKNLLSYTEQFDNSAWGKLRVTVTPNAVVAPDGTTTADKVVADTQNNYHSVSQTYVVSNGTAYTASVYAKAAEYSYLSLADTGFSLFAAVFYLSGSGSVTMTNGTVTNTSITNVGNGWYRCTVSFTGGAYSVLVGYIGLNTTVSFPGGGYYQGDGTSGIYIWGAQLELGSTATIYQGIAAANTLIATGVTNKVTSDGIYSSGIFDEVTYNTTSPVIKNLLTYTEQFDNAAWGKTGVAISQNSTVAPDGSTTADTVTSNVTNNVSSTAQGASITSGTTYTFSAYFKAGNVNRALIGLRYGPSNYTDNIYDFSSNTWITLGAGTASAVALGSGWYRLIVTVTAIGSGTYAPYVGPINNNGTAFNSTTSGNFIYAWGAQLEVGSTATIYQGIAAANTLVTPVPSQRKDNQGNMYVSNVFDEFTGAPVVDSSLVLWLDAGQTASYSGSGTTWTDLSGKGNNGTLINSPTYINNSFLFNGVDQVCTLAASGTIPTGASARTISIWFYTTTTSWAVDANNLFYYGQPSPGKAFGIDMDNFPSMQFYTWGYDLTFSTTFSQVGWHNISVTYDGSTAVKIYENGQPTQTLTTPVLNTTSSIVYISSAGNAISAYYEGNISEVSIYNRALTADEVAQNYNALKRRYGLT